MHAGFKRMDIARRRVLHDVPGEANARKAPDEAGNPQRPIPRPA